MSAKATARVVTAANGAIHAYVPAATLYNIDATQALTRSILGRTGCPTCHSGLPILFMAEEQEFQVEA